MPADYAFGFNFTSKAVKILSNGLYSDKISAVIRELSCNAYDSHVAAGKSDIPFEVHLPDYREPWFSVKDVGLGISDADVYNIYTKYFSSTKVGDNSQIGELGLGSKSPFSLVKEFEVTSCYNGTASKYRMYIDEVDMPRVTLLEQHLTQECNGLTVTFKTTDNYEFQTKAKKVLCWFKTTPIIKNSSESIAIENLSIPDWAYFSTRTRYSAPLALMGNVAYPLDKHSIKGMIDQDYKLLNLPVVIRFDIGELEVAASREGLGYDERTCANINSKLTTVANELYKQYANKINVAESEWNAHIIWNECFGTDVPFQWELIDFFKNRTFNWRNIPIKGNRVKLDMTKFYSGFEKNAVRYMSQGDSTLKRIDINQFNIDCSTDIKIVFDDLPKNGVTRLRYSKLNDNKKVYLFSKPLVGDWPELFQNLGCPPIVWTSELPPHIVVKTKKATNMYQYDINHNNWTKVNIDLSQGGFYYENTESKIQLDPLLTIAHNIKLINAIPVVYTNTPKQLIKIKKMQNWKNIVEYLKELFIQYLDKNAHLVDYITTAGKLDQIKYNLPNRNIFNYNWDIRDEHSVFKQFIAEYTEIIEAVRYIQWEKIKRLASILHVQFDKKESKIKIEQTLEEVKHRYPMLMLLDGFKFGSSIQEIQDYVNMVDMSWVYFELSKPMPIQEEET